MLVLNKEKNNIVKGIYILKSDDVGGRYFKVNIQGGHVRVDAAKIGGVMPHDVGKKCVIEYNIAQNYTRLVYIEN